jgi:hypothetical protein
VIREGCFAPVIVQDITRPTTQRSGAILLQFGNLIGVIERACD